MVEDTRTGLSNLNVSKSHLDQFPTEMKAQGAATLGVLEKILFRLNIAIVHLAILVLIPNAVRIFIYLSAWCFL